MSLSLLHLRCYDLSKHIAQTHRFRVFSLRLLNNSTNRSPKVENVRIIKLSDNKQIDKDSLKLTKRDMFKIAVRDYGKTVIAFHVGISLISLGLFYSAVSSGVDMTPVINFITQDDSEKFNTTVINSSTFLIAYGIHKLFAPVRISITLACTPLLVRYLRRIGFLKHTVMKNVVPKN